MLRLLKTNFWRLFTSVDARLKFPELKKGEIGVQCGFDMSAPVTSDLFLMSKRVGTKGTVVGIDPDPSNCATALRLAEHNQLHMIIYECALFSEPGTTGLIMGAKASWNQLTSLPQDTSVELTNEIKSVRQDTLDHIIQSGKINISEIAHINLTLNGAEYYALLGMQHILHEAKDLALTIIAGRQDESGVINGTPDYKMIIPLLHTYGFRTQFRRINQLFWWGFVVSLIVKRRWIYHRKNYGVIFAAKGSKRIRWYQSFS